ncbi:MAG TPA: asparaginase domain-containing protein [Gemmatimonadales bacterium]|nr:asparaginase domain-containing protein [Gemmatimonadales bacterium]
MDTASEEPAPRVALIGTGGTISSLGRDSLDVWEYMDGGQKIGRGDLLARYPETARVATVVPVPYRAVGSSFIGPADWLRLRETIGDAARREAPLAGVVITHGTATLEETAYFLNLAVRAPISRSWSSGRSGPQAGLAPMPG